MAAALLARDTLLNRLLSDWTLILLDIATHSLGEIMVLPPGDSVIDGPGNFHTDPLGNLAANWLRGSCPDHGRGVTLERDLEESQEKGRGENCPHLERIRCTCT